MAVALFVAFWSTTAAAYPWMLKHGYAACASCHVDPSGGELLNGYGRVQGYTLLTAKYGAVRNAPDDPLWGVLPLPGPLALGGSYRHLSVIKPGAEDKFATFPMQADLYAGVTSEWFAAGGSIGAAKVPAGSPHARAAQVTSGQGDDLNLISRTHWLGIVLGPRAMLRGGRINLPFGLRIPDHTFWVRDATRTDRESDQQHGLSAVYSGERWRGELMMVFGNYQIRPDRYRERGYSAFFEWALADRVTLGTSSLTTRAFADRLTLEPTPTTRQAHGLFSRMAPTKSLFLQTEFDVLMISRSSPGYVGLIAFDFEPVQGVHLLLDGEVLDRGKPDGVEASRGGGEPRFGGWFGFEYYFLPQMNMRLDAVVRQDDPFTLLSQLHVYL